VNSAVANPLIVIREPGRIPLRLAIKEPLQIGRDCSGLLLTDPQISRLHLEIRAEAGQLVVTDLDSTNGSIIDGRPLTEPTALMAGSIVRLGDTTVELVTDIRSTVVIAPQRMGSETDLRRTSIDIVADAVVAARPDLGAVSADQGTITIVFSDIESSTQRLETLGDQMWFELLSVHNRIVRGQVARHGGTEVKAQGDGFMLTFPSARSAITCMSDVQRDLAKHSTEQPEQQIRIRVGIHTGEAISSDDGDIFGKHVNLAARIANEAAGAEVLVSSLVRELVESRGDLKFGEPRSAELKGLAGPHTMFPIVWQ